jgi:hypothetical protein
MVIVGRAVISGLLVCAYDKNNRIIPLNAGHPIRFCGKNKKMLPKALIIKKGTFINDVVFKECGKSSFFPSGYRTHVPGR